MNNTLTLVAVILGLVLVLLSAVWGSMFPATSNWSDDKSEQLAELGSETNRLQFELIQAKNNRSVYSGRNPGEIQEEYDAAIAKYNELQAEFETVRDAPNKMAGILRWVGIGLVLLGGATTFISRGGA